MTRSILLRSLLAASAIAIALPAFAADIAPQTYEPAEAQMPYSWTGFYVGGHVGGGWGNSNVNYPGPSLFKHEGNSGGLVGGVHAGYNYQINQFVVGAEADFDLTGLRSSNIFPIPIETRQSWLGSVRGRVGYSFDRLLIYGTGGVAFTNLKFSSPSISSSLLKDGSRTGWVAGLGAEYAIDDHWVAGVEWKHYDFGKKSFITGAPVFKMKQSDDTIMARISYKF